MKKSRRILPVEMRDIVNIHTGEMSLMPVPAPAKVPMFSYMFTLRHRELLKDARMTGEAWRVLGMLITYGAYETNEVQKPIGFIAKELGLQRQHVGRAIRLLREIGVVLPSQAWGKYHLHADLVFRGDLQLRAHLLRQQGIRKR